MNLLEQIGNLETEEVTSKWYYNPKAGFTRTYSRRNPSDDFADSFAFFILNCKSQLPENKVEFLDKKLSLYLN